jgi:4-alpha-glucanotransferase
MYVMQYAIPGPDRPPDPVPPRAVASLNTHDAPPFKGFWDALDVDDQLDLGLVDGARAEGSRHYRWALRWGLAQTMASLGLLDGAPDDPRAVLSAALTSLGQGPAALVLVNLEDLWLEHRPQNVPGTWLERPNWRRPARYDRETFARMGEVLDVLRRVDAARRRAP